MTQLWMNITLIGEIIGFIILSKNGIDIIKIQKQLSKKRDKELILDEDRSKIIRKYTLFMIGNLLLSISSIIRILLR